MCGKDYEGGVFSARRRPQRNGGLWNWGYARLTVGADAARWAYGLRFDDLLMSMRIGRCCSAVVRNRSRARSEDAGKSSLGGVVKRTTVRKWGLRPAV